MTQSQENPEGIDLRDPLRAAFWALLWPGAGHVYQRRYAKAVIFMICILSLFAVGWTLGGKRVVYASWRNGDRRWQYLCQVWVGLPAWPAILQTVNITPFGEDFMRRPSLPPQWYDQQPLNSDQPTEAALWQMEDHGDYELGTVLTMIAGLLNLLVIFDAAAGPVRRGKSKQVEEENGSA